MSRRSTRLFRRISMLRSACLCMTVITLLMCYLFVQAGIAQANLQSDLLAHYNGNGKDDTGLNADFELRNTKFVEDALYLNGLYAGLNAAGKGYRAIGHASRLDYQVFSINLRFKLATLREGASQPNLITGGIFFRWFGLRFSDTKGGKLIVYFNNGDFATKS